MKFQQGNKHGQGRKKGSKNQTPTKVREAFLMLVENNLDRLQADLESLDPKDRIKAITELAKFNVPTLKQIDFEGDVTDLFKPVTICL